MQGTGFDRRRRIISLVLFLGLLLALIAVDQITKYYFKGLCEGNGNITVIKNFFVFTYKENDGAAWSFLSGVSWAQTFFKVLTAISLLVFGLFFYYAYKKEYKWLKVSLTLIMAGTIGNFIDRLLLSYVIDFISLQFGNYYFPVFNFADSCLTVGVIMLVFHYLFLDKDAIFRKKQEEDKQSSDSEEKSTLETDNFDETTTGLNNQGKRDDK